MSVEAETAIIPIMEVFWGSKMDNRTRIGRNRTIGRKR